MYYYIYNNFRINFNYDECKIFIFKLCKLFKLFVLTTNRESFFLEYYKLLTMLGEMIRLEIIR